MEVALVLVALRTERLVIEDEAELETRPPLRVAKSATFNVEEAFKVPFTNTFPAKLEEAEEINPLEILVKPLYKTENKGTVPVEF